MASIDDVYSVASVLLESFIEYRPSYTPDGFAATTPSAEQIIARMNEGPLWIALLDGVAWGQYPQRSRQNQFTSAAWPFYLPQEVIA